MPSVATRRRRALNIQNRMEAGADGFDSAASSTHSKPASSLASSLPSPSLLALPLLRPSLLSVALLPLLLLAGYLYGHRGHVGLGAMALIVGSSAGWVLGFFHLFEAQLQSKQSQQRWTVAGL